MSEPVRRIRPDQLTEADPTPGMRRERAFEAPGLWAGLVHTEPGATSGWHHHGEHETSLYVIRGTMRLEFGPGGSGRAAAAAGISRPVPAPPAPRESTRAGEPSPAVIARAGRGVPTVNVDGPDPAG